MVQNAEGEIVESRKGGGQKRNNGKEKCALTVIIMKCHTHQCTCGELLKGSVLTGT